VFREHVAWLNLFQDGRSFLGNRSLGNLGLLGWLASIATARCFAYWALDDPRPSWTNSRYGLRFLAPVLQLLRRMASAVRGRGSRAEPQRPARRA